MNKLVLILVFGLILVGFVSGFNADNFSGHDKVRMIVRAPALANDNSKMVGVSSVSIVDGAIKNDLGDRFSVEVSLEELEELRNQGFDIIGEDKLVHAFLQDAEGIVGADTTWGLNVSGLSVNGSNVAVCIIDTGVDSTHTDLAGKVLDEYCYCSVAEGAESNCCPDTSGEDDNASDNSGHGTHVAGIVAASSGIDGIARGANIVAVKVLNSSGVGASSDIRLGIEWCTNDTQVDAYNISVISLSLGGGQYNNSADCVSADSAEIRTAINAAWAKNISVVIATGNGDPVNATKGISSPACLGNTTKVTASNKSDNYASYAFRHSAFSDILVAPGSSINSTNNGGGYRVDSGTSMAAPMISGAIAIINQYLTLSGQTKTPTEISGLLNSTGTALDDSAGSGYNFSRINIYDAVLSLDVDAPDVTLVSPVDNHINLTANQTFVCNATDWQLANVTFKIWNSSGLYHNETKNLTGDSNETNFSLMDIVPGSYEWNCLTFDNLNNSDYASANYSLVIKEIEVSLDSPENNSYTNVANTNFTCTSIGDSSYELSNVTFSLWNSSGNLTYNLTQDISGFDNETIFNWTFVDEGFYYWNCLGVNNRSNESWGDSNFSVNYDASVPVISSLDENPDETSAVISWTTDDAANSSISVSGGSWSNSSSYVTSHSVRVSGLTASRDYTYVVVSCNRAGGCANDSGSFTTDAESTTSSTGGDDASSDDDDATASDTTNELTNAGYFWILEKDDVVNFKIDSDPHTLSVVEVRNNSVEILIESDPIRVNISVDEEMKFNVSSVDHYDLHVRLNSISGGNANITMKKIYELIVVNGNESDVTMYDISEEDVLIDDFSSRDVIGSVAIVIIVILEIVIIVWIVSRIKPKKLNKKKGSEKKSGVLKTSGHVKKKVKKNNGKKNKKT